MLFRRANCFYKQNNGVISKLLLLEHDVHSALQLNARRLYLARLYSMCNVCGKSAMVVKSSIKSFKSPEILLQRAT